MFVSFHKVHIAQFLNKKVDFLTLIYMEHSSGNNSPDTGTVKLYPVTSNKIKNGA